MSTIKSKNSVVFCKRELSFTDSQVRAKLATIADDKLARVNRYYVIDSRKRKCNITDVMKHCAKIELVWRTGRTGNLVGTYSTMQAMRALVRLRITVYDSQTAKRIALADVLSAKHTAK